MSSSTTGRIYTDQIKKGIDFARHNGAHIINASFGGYGEFDQAFFDTIQNFTNQGGVFITAAGNDKNNNNLQAVYPCNFNTSNANIICVAAHDSSNKLASFSNYGTSVNISAPGVNIYSTLSSNAYGNSNGTSMATPHVVGAFSLLRNYRPDLTALQIKTKIYEGSETVTNYYGPIENNRKLNLFNALKLLDNKPPVFTEIDRNISDYCLNDVITYHITGVDDIALSGNAYSFDT